MNSMELILKHEARRLMKSQPWILDRGERKKVSDREWRRLVEANFGKLDCGPKHTIRNQRCTICGRSRQSLFGTKLT